MGFSKKKQKNFVKAQGRVGVKAKQKAKKFRQIEHREELRASKRRASEATGKASSKAGRTDDDLREIKSVDALFASVGQEDDASDLVHGAGSDEESDDESSAGAFHDVGDAEQDGPAAPVRGVVEELEDDEADAGARHEQELKAIKEKDPDFYKFLVEQDRSLLNFQAPADDEEAGAPDAEHPAADDEDSEGGLVGEDVAGDSAVPAGKLLSRERFERVQSSAKDSWTACKAALNIYHTAVRSIKEQQDVHASQKQEPGGKKGKRGPKARAEPKRRRGVFRIEDESIFSEVIEWSIANMLPLLRHHAGDLRTSSSVAGRKQKKTGKGSELTGEKSSEVAGLVDPTRFTRWTRVRPLISIFLEETLFLLNHVAAHDMLEYVLRHCSTPDALSWLWPFKPIRQRYVRRCCQLWSTSSSHNVRLLSFLLLRNAAAMILHSPDAAGSKGGGQQLEALLRAAMRSFADVAAWGFSWKTLNTFRFMENCIIELLRLEDATAYRLGYVCLRQLALLLRNACLSASQGASAEGQIGGGEKTKKSRRQVSAQQQTQALTSWPFVRAVSLWTRAVGTVGSLRPLAYPLSMIVMGAVKHKLTSLHHFPFVFHCLVSLNRLGSLLEVFVPISSHVLKALGVTLQAMDTMHKKRAKGGEAQTLDSSVKAPEVEVSLRLSDAQVASSLALEAVGNSLCFLLVDHLGLLSQSPAFPEMVSPIVLHLRKHSKHCKSETLRKQLKSLIEKVEGTLLVVRSRREALSAVPSATKFLVFEADGPIAKARAEALRRRAAEEKARVQAELQDEGQGAAEAPAKDAPKGKKRKGEDRGVDESRGKLGKRKKQRDPVDVAKLARAGGALPDRDKVEEMDFSSGADE